MPYITQEARAEILGLERPAETTGELTFVISTIIADYVNRKGLSYQTIAEARIAALDSAQELYRVVAAPYEDAKEAANGPVFTSSLVIPGALPYDQRNATGNAFNNRFVDAVFDEAELGGEG